ncbi:MAG: hypothetical protein HZB17_04645 [Chloroflexi bacterium]|nr:hypothetical protein [Chloroflexota bacterium]
MSESYWAIFWGGLAVGVLDLTAAFITSGVRGRNPIWVMQSIASGLLGAEAFKGGLRAAALGVVCHFFIAFTVTTVYYVASLNFNILVEQILVCGVLYGVAVYGFMYFIVLPRSAFPFKITFTPAVLANGITIHIFCVGLPIALAVRWFAK